MASLIEAIEIKRKMFFEFEDAPFHLPRRGGLQTHRTRRPDARPLKMRNLLTRAVFDKTFKAGEKFAEPDLVKVPATYQYADTTGYHFMDQETFDTLTLGADALGDDRLLLADNLEVQIHKYNGNPIGVQFPPHVELTVTSTEPGVRGDTASGGVTKAATLETRPRDSGAALHQGRRKGEGPHRNARLRRPGLSVPAHASGVVPVEDGRRHGCRQRHRPRDGAEVRGAKAGRSPSSAGEPTRSPIRRRARRTRPGRAWRPSHAT